MREALFRNLHVDPLSLHTSMRNKQEEFNPYIYTLSKLYRFGYEISVFLIQNTRSLFYGRLYSSLHRLISLHGKLNVKIFLTFIVAENTGSVNIQFWKLRPTARHPRLGQLGSFTFHAYHRTDTGTYEDVC